MLVIVFGFAIVSAPICGVVDVGPERIRVGPFQRAAVRLIAEVSGAGGIQARCCYRRGWRPRILLASGTPTIRDLILVGARKSAGAGGAGLSGGGIRALIWSTRPPQPGAPFAHAHIDVSTMTLFLTCA